MLEGSPHSLFYPLFEVVFMLRFFFQYFLADEGADAFECGALEEDSVIVVALSESIEASREFLF